MHAKNRSKRRWLSGPELRHTANGSEKLETGLQTGKMAYDHETSVKNGVSTVPQSIPTKKRRDQADKDQGKIARDNQDGCSYCFSIFSSRALPTEKDREELIALKEQVEDLQRKLLEKEELLKSAEISKTQMTSMKAKFEELKHQATNKDSLIKSTQLQLCDAKKCWSIVKEDVLHFMRDFHLNAKLWWWRFGVEESALCKEVICGKYIEQGRDWFPSTDRDSRLSKIWGDIVNIVATRSELLHFFRSNAVVLIGDGQRSRFWTDCWSGGLHKGVHWSVMLSSGCLALYGGLPEHCVLESFAVGVAWHIFEPILGGPQTSFGVGPKR
ncbi:hypothetical protein HYC85_029960 [Camellia sinensis]|uniref:Uncharacterized protein n=1 Tax=Camellia sinensis TaxID=4442 RepID=A0A7J7FZJ2_CAMSI|nr:hypothetical protein HYC85_029960 [Camellia sinensis]